MHVDPKYLDITFDQAGVRNSQKRLKSLISELAVEPMNQYHEELINHFSLVEEIIMERIANVITYWCQHKHDPVCPSSQDKMSEITNAGRNDSTLAAFYVNEVKNAMYTLAPMLGLEMPDHYTPHTEELEFALLELEDNFVPGEAGDNYDSGDEAYEQEDESIDVTGINLDTKRDFSNLSEIVDDERSRAAMRERAIVAAQNQVIEVEQPVTALHVVSLNAEEAWHLIYGLIGYSSEYIQETMLPRWQQYPASFDKDRKFLYQQFIDLLRNSAGLQQLSGNYTFADRQMTIDQLWSHYFTDLSQRVAPQLAAARLHTAANDPWWKKLRQSISKEFSNFSAIWLLALAIALVFDGLTTYISLDQTPMEGPIVIIFTVLITALFQIADQLVINYRKREFEAQAMSAKYRAQYERYSKSVEQLDITSESYVQLSMERSKSLADWKATEDNRKMARRGRFWSARIADINVIITAYGFAFLFLNSQEPMVALAEQFRTIFVDQAWERVDLWVFLMVGLAVTVSFVVNTAQRTEILGWSMRRLKNES